MDMPVETPGTNGAASKSSSSSLSSAPPTGTTTEGTGSTIPRAIHTIREQNRFLVHHFLRHSNLPLEPPPPPLAAVHPFLPSPPVAAPSGYHHHDNNGDDDDDYDDGTMQSSRSSDASPSSEVLTQPPAAVPLLLQQQERAPNPMGTGDRHDAIDLTSDTDMEDHNMIMEESFFLNPTPSPVPSSSLLCSPPPLVAVVTMNSRKRRNIQESKVAHLDDDGDRDAVDMDTSMDPIVTTSDGGDGGSATATNSTTTSLHHHHYHHPQQQEHQQHCRLEGRRRSSIQESKTAVSRPLPSPPTLDSATSSSSSSSSSHSHGNTTTTKKRTVSRKSFGPSSTMVHRPSGTDFPSSGTPSHRLTTARNGNNLEDSVTTNSTATVADVAVVEPNQKRRRSSLPQSSSSSWPHSEQQKEDTVPRMQQPITTTTTIENVAPTSVSATAKVPSILLPTFHHPSPAIALPTAVCDDTNDTDMILENDEDDGDHITLDREEMARTLPTLTDLVKQCWTCAVPLLQEQQEHRTNTNDDTPADVGGCCYYYARHTHVVLGQYNIPMCSICAEDVAAMEQQRQLHQPPEDVQRTSPEYCSGCAISEDDYDDTFFLCDTDHCTRMFCFHCVAKCSGGGPKGIARTQQLVHDDASVPWYCPACCVPPALIQLQQLVTAYHSKNEPEPSGAAGDGGVVRDIDYLLGQLAGAEEEKQRCEKELGSDTHLEQKKLELRQSILDDPSVVAVTIDMDNNDLDVLVQIAFDQWHEDWVHHERRISDYISGILEELDTEHSFTAHMCYTAIDMVDLSKQDSSPTIPTTAVTEDWINAANMEIDLRIQERRCQYEKNILTDAAYDNEDFGDVEDLGTMVNTETEHSSWRATGDDGDANNFAKLRPGFASLHARPSMKKIEEAIQHETLLNVAVQNFVSDDQDQQHILEEKKSAILVSCNDDTSSNNHHGERFYVRNEFRSVAEKLKRKSNSGNNSSSSCIDTQQQQLRTTPVFPTTESDSTYGTPDAFSENDCGSNYATPDTIHYCTSTSGRIFVPEMSRDSVSIPNVLAGELQDVSTHHSSESLLECSILGDTASIQATPEKVRVDYGVPNTSERIVLEVLQEHEPPHPTDELPAESLSHQDAPEVVQECAVEREIVSIPPTPEAIHKSELVSIQPPDPDVLLNNVIGTPPVDARCESVISVSSSTMSNDLSDGSPVQVPRAVSLFAPSSTEPDTTKTVTANHSISSDGCLDDVAPDYEKKEPHALYLCHRSDAPNQDGIDPIRTVRVAQQLSKQLKPHQVDGVKFMWRNCFSDFSYYRNGNVQHCGGCILAHNMGLVRDTESVSIA
jgi:hypothetical protein